MIDQFGIACFFNLVGEHALNRLFAAQEIPVTAALISTLEWIRANVYWPLRPHCSRYTNAHDALTFDI